MQPKKVLTLLLVVAMTLICGVTSVSAQDNASAFAMAVDADASTALAEEPCSIKPGDTVDVSVTITKNPGLTKLKFALIYDTTALTLKTNEDKTVAFTSDKLFGENAESVVLSEVVDGKVVYIASTSNNVTATGTVLKLTFTVKDTFHGETPIVLADYEKNASGTTLVDGKLWYTTYSPEVTDANTADYKKATISAHKFGDPTVVEPTCEAAGKKSYPCTIEGCTHVLEVPNGDAKGHTFVPMTEKAPTCTETGLTGGSVCSVCGHVETPQTEVAAKGHEMGEWVEEDGFNVRKCANCDYTEKEELKSNVGLIVGIIVGVVVVLGAAGACLYFFVFKKKKA